MRKRVGINIWDDYSEAEGTYIIVEDNSISLEESHKILENLIPLLKPFFNKSALSINLYDTKKVYPNFDRSPINIANTGWRDWSRWEIRVKPISYEDLDTALHEKDLLNTTLKVLDYDLFFYSES